MAMDKETLVYVQPSLARVKKICFPVSVVLCVLLLVSCIVLAVLYSQTFSDSSSSSKKKLDVCLDDQCFDKAKEMAHNMDLKVDPCQDFDSYACGGWKRRHQLTANQTSINRISLLIHKNLAILKKALEQSSVNYSQNVAVMKTARVYRSCLNTTAMTSQGLQPMRDLITKYGGWSVSNNYNKNVTVGTRIGQVARDLNVDTLFGVIVRSDIYDSSKTILQLIHASIEPLSLYVGKDADSIKARDNYKKIMTLVGKWLGGKDSYDKMMAIYEFEVKLAKIALNEDPERIMKESLLRSSRSSLPFPDFRITIDELCWSIPVFFECSELKKVLAKVLGQPITGKEKLLNGEPSTKAYFKRLYNLYQNHADNQQIMADYITWRFVYEYTLALSPEYVSQILAIRGLPATYPRWKSCIEEMLNTFDMSLGLLYVDANFDVQTRKTLRYMTDAIRKSFIARLPKQTWMDKETQRKAKEKALAITVSIGFPDYIRDPAKLEEKYKRFNVHDDCFANYKEMNHFLKMKNVMTYKKPVDKKSWPSSPAEVNAFYDSIQNRIVYLAGIVQPPVFDPRSPSYLNYGGIGTVVGHELTHGFDNSGRLFNKYGDFENWWSNSADLNFKEKSSCLVEQYNKYKVFDKKVNGSLTLNENIADNGGIKIAYDAYQRWIADNKEEKILPGLQLNPDQLFFVGFAQLWCSVENREGAIKDLKGTHSPGKYRVLGSLSNFEKFSQVFKCPKGSPMNPRKKCSVW